MVICFRLAVFAFEWRGVTAPMAFYCASLLGLLC